MAAAAPLGMPSGKIAHHPGWKPLQGSANDHVPGWTPSPCRLPGPVPGYETCLRRVFTAATVSSTPSQRGMVRSLRHGFSPAVPVAVCKLIGAGHTCVMQAKRQKQGIRHLFIFTFAAATLPQLSYFKAYAPSAAGGDDSVRRYLREAADGDDSVRRCRRKDASVPCS